MSGILVILSGPSGVGKDTVIDTWIKTNPSVKRVVTCTTRAPRPGEQDGIDYHFLTPKQFQSKIQKNQLLEYKQVHHYHYGTPLDQLEAIIANNQIGILKIDVQGALEVMPKHPEILTIFLLPPSNEILENRLRSRATDSPEQIESRLKTAKEEIALAPTYQHQIINDDLNKTVEKLQELAKNHQCQTSS